MFGILLAPALYVFRVEKENPMTIKIIPNDKGNPPGKLADAELHFTTGALEGLKLIGFQSGKGGSAMAATSHSRRGNTR
jgi:hypothetical protein